jgi:hypothetical protein
MENAMSDSVRNAKTPMFEALHASRYHRQERFRKFQDLTGSPLIAYVGGPDSLIERSDTVYFNDLLYRLRVNTSIDLLLHTSGGDIDAAEKLMSILRLRVGIGRLRVIVPDFAKSAGTLMAIGADSIVMSDTSELGHIDPQVTMVDGDGDRATQSIQAYLDAYEQLSQGLDSDPNDVVAQLLLNKFEPARIVHFESVKARAREFAENQLKRMCPGIYTCSWRQNSSTRSSGVHTGRCPSTNSRRYMYDAACGGMQKALKPFRRQLPAPIVERLTNAPRARRGIESVVAVALTEIAKK